MTAFLKSRQTLILLALLAGVLAAALLALSDERSRLSGSPAPARQRQLAEAGQARSLQVIWVDSQTGRASYIIDADDNRLAAAGASVSAATPVAGEADESFSKLLVFSFGAGDTLELAYSPELNLLMNGDVFYAPAGDLENLIGDDASD